MIRIGSNQGYRYHFVHGCVCALGAYHNDGLCSVARELSDPIGDTVVIVGHDVNKVLSPRVENDVFFTQCINADHAISHGFSPEADGHGAEATACPCDDDPVAAISSRFFQGRIGRDSFG